MGKTNDIRDAVIGDLKFDPEVGASDVRVEEEDGDRPEYFVVVEGHGFI